MDRPAIVLRWPTRIFEAKRMLRQEIKVRMVGHVMRLLIKQSKLLDLRSKKICSTNFQIIVLILLIQGLL
jgi:hypothetical protein